MSDTSHRRSVKAAGDVLKFNDGWALAGFYPESLRSRIAAQAEAKPKAAKRTTQAKTKTVKMKTVQAKANSPAGPSLDERVLAHLRTKGASGSKDIAAALTADSKLVAMALARLIGRKKITKGEDGRYSATPKTQPEQHLRAV